MPPRVAESRGPSWAAWLALALSTVALVVSTTVGALWAVDRFGAAEDEGWFYDAGMPAWGFVDLSPSGAVTELALTDSVEESVTQMFEDVYEEPPAVTELYCDALPAAPKDTVASCGLLIDDIDSTIVVHFLDDEGAYLATVY